MLRPESQVKGNFRCVCLWANRINAYKQFSALNVTEYTYVPVYIHNKRDFITSDSAGLLTGLDIWLKTDVCPFMF